MRNNNINQIGKHGLSVQLTSVSQTHNSLHFFSLLHWLDYISEVVFLIFVSCKPTLALHVDGQGKIKKMMCWYTYSYAIFNHLQQGM